MNPISLWAIEMGWRVVAAVAAIGFLVWSLWP